MAFENMQMTKDNKKILVLCIYCGKEIDTPELKVTVGKSIRGNPKSYRDESTIFLSASHVLKYLEMNLFESDDLKLEIDGLRRFNKQIFWNLLYYFQEYKLPFDFMLPYEDSTAYETDYKELIKQEENIYNCFESIDEEPQDFIESTV